MNKHRYISKIIKSRFKYESKFKKMILRSLDLKIDIVVEKIRDKKDIDEYVKPLKSFYNKNYLIYPKPSFNTNNFSSIVDLAFLDTKYHIVKVIDKAKPNTTYDFDSKFYIVLIMEKNKIKSIGLTEGMKLKLTKYIKGIEYRNQTYNN